MLAAILTIVTAASALGTEPPSVVASFESTEKCVTAQRQLSKLHADELTAKGAALVCFKVVYPV